MEYVLKAFLLVGIIGMVGCSSAFKYEKYTDQDPELDLSVDYISGWKATPQKGSYGSFTQVVFIEPRKKDKTLPALMVLTLKRESKADFSPLTIEGAYVDLTIKRRKFKDFKALSRSRMKLLDTEAIVSEFAYKALDLPESLKAKLVPTREKVVIFKREDKFYFLRYENFAEDFGRYEQAFNRVIKSLKARD